MGLFWAAHGWEGSKKAPLLKTCQPYPTMIKLGTVIPYLKKNQNISRRTSQRLVSSASFSPEISKISYIKKDRYRVHYNA